MTAVKALPVDIETERLVIGALLIDPEAVPLTIHQLDAEDFATVALAEITEVSE